MNYSPYGEPMIFDPADFNRNGEVEGGDLDEFNAAYAGSIDINDPATFMNALADVNFDGDRDATDQAQFDAAWLLASTEGPASDRLGLNILYAGYCYDPHLGLYHVRHRVYDPARGRWMQRDPIGYLGGPNLYAYVSGEPMGYVDPMGLMSWDAKWGVIRATIGIVQAASTAITTVADWVNNNRERIAGGLRAAGGIAEIVSGFTIGFTGVGAPLGLVLVAHGLDQTIAGGRSVWDNRHHQSLYEFAVYSIARASGLDEYQARRGAEISDVLLSVGLGVTTMGVSGGLRGGAFAIAGGGAVAVSTAASGVELAGAVGIGAAAVISNEQGGADTCYNNGYRTPDGKFASPTGDLPRAGKEAVAQATRELEAMGFKIRESEVQASVAGRSRVYDLVVEKDGLFYGVEIKSGGAMPTAEQRAFDSYVRAYNGEGVRIGPKGSGAGINRLKGVITYYVP